MPIFMDYKKETDEYEILGINHEINGKDFKYIQALRNMVGLASIHFVYKSDGVFCNSISKASKFNTNIANFDIGRCGGRYDEAHYSAMMREFINQCNTELEKSHKLQFKGSRFDILGGWTRGEIVLMVPKNKRGWKR